MIVFNKISDKGFQLPTKSGSYDMNLEQIQYFKERMTIKFERVKCIMDFTSYDEQIDKDTIRKIVYKTSDCEIVSNENFTNELNPPDLCSTQFQEEFSRYIKYWYMLNEMTVESLAVKMGVDIKTVRRYLPGPQQSLPKCIPDFTYYSFLNAVGKTHKEFYVASKSDEKTRITIRIDKEFHNLTPPERYDLLKVIMKESKCNGGCVIESIDEGCIKYTILVSPSDAEKLQIFNSRSEKQSITIYRGKPNSPLVVDGDAKRLSDIRVSLSLNYSDIDIAAILDLDLMIVKKLVRSIILTGINKVVNTIESELPKYSCEHQVFSKIRSVAVNTYNTSSIHYTKFQRLYYVYNRRRNDMKDLNINIQEDLRNQLIRWGEIELKYLYGLCISMFRNEYLKLSTHTETTRIMCLLLLADKCIWKTVTESTKPSKIDTLETSDLSILRGFNDKHHTLSSWIDVNKYTSMDCNEEYENKLYVIFEMSWTIVKEIIKTQKEAETSQTDVKLLDPSS